MTTLIAAVASAGLWAFAGAAPAVARESVAQVSTARAAETISAIRVHGNHVTSDADIIALSGVTPGAPFETTTIEDVTRRLRESHKFDDVTVLKRFASIADPTLVVLVIIVNEGPVRIDLPDVPGEPTRVLKRGVLSNFMFMPIFDGEDGYGFTYGARVAYVGLVGKRSRVSFPLTWGGMKRAGAEFEHNFSRGPLTRVEIGTAIQRQTNPAFELDDDRTRAWARAERAIGDLRFGGTTGWQRVTFGSLKDDFRSIGADVTFDTRVDPALPRNAVFAAASWERLSFASGGDVERTKLDARGYIGFIRQTVIVVRAVRHDADRPLPDYLKPLLGGWSSLRGFKAGSFVGDTAVSGSIELRIPLNSPIELAKIGVSVFVDAGKAYDKGQRFRDVTLEKGIGGSVWMTASVLRLSLGVARGLGASTRVNFGGGLTF